MMKILFGIFNKITVNHVYSCKSQIKPVPGQEKHFFSSLVAFEGVLINMGNSTLLVLLGFHFEEEGFILGEVLILSSNMIYNDAINSMAKKCQ